MSSTSSPASAGWLLRAAPILFVLIWSTGWIAARYAAPFADPLTFLSVRYALAGLALSVIALSAGARWPTSPQAILHALVSGVLLHAIYLGGVWYAVAHGLSAGLSGLIAAVQPILTALLAPTLLGERISARNWAGILLGFVGIAVVLEPRLSTIGPGYVVSVLGPILVNLAAMLSVTLGTFYQKRWIAGGDLRTITVLQYVGAVAATLPVAWLTESMRMDWNLTLALTMAWSVAGLSMGGIALLLMLIRRGAVSKAATLIYLVPPSVAVEAYLLFGEEMTLLQVLGMALTVLGVALATRRSVR